MSEWKAYKIADAPLDILDGDRGRNYPSQEDLKSTGSCLFLSTKNVRQNGFEFSDCEYISDERDKLMRKGKLVRHDLVLTTRGTVGNLAFFSEKVKFDNVRINSGMVIVRPNQAALSPIFNYYLFRNLQRSFSEFTSGSAQPQLPIRDLKEIEILIPSLQTQVAVAEILASLDDKIDLLQRQNRTLEAMAEALFREWFVEGAKESWTLTTLADHTQVFRGLSYKGSGLTSEGGGLPMHNLNSVYEFGGYKSAGIKYYNGEFRERHLVYHGDIIVTNTEQGHEHRLIGFPGIVPQSFGEKGLFSQHIYRLVPKAESYLSREYLYYLLMVPTIREQVIAETNGSTVNMLAIEGLQRPEFRLPDKITVEKFTNIVHEYWEKKETNNNQIQSLTRLRDTLLPRLMSGVAAVTSY
jgi:type I restriction enzyme, S subunit